ncbi:MAG: hypothetical protein RMJ56_14625 [Gemmataceae bacterium]|nr:DUF1349 domain-containing protein [Gemmata sp.]MDW8198829.1 hypothetical protein [Gemmataceae bacterium]
MMRTALLLTLAMLPWVAVAAPAPPLTDKQRLARDWGTLAGPGEYRFDGERLILRSHTGMRASELNNTALCTVPRITRTVRGDFDMTLRVLDLTHPLSTESQGNLGQFTTSAGLVVMSDDAYISFGLNQIYYRLVNFPNPDVLHRYVYLQAIMINQGGTGWGHSHEDGKATYLRLKRQGEKILAAHSFDGEKWTDAKDVLANQNFALPDEVTVGVFVLHNTHQVVQATFDRFTLTQPSSSNKLFK